MTNLIDKQLRRLRLQNRDARNIFDTLRKYERNRKEVQVDVLHYESGLEKRAIREVFRLLEELNLGVLKLGRRQKKTRFVWHENFLGLIPGPQPGEPSKSDAKGLQLLEPNGRVSLTVVNEWVIKLGAHRLARVYLPANKTNADIQAMCDFFDKLLLKSTAEAK